jgi:hypothetical protein
LPSIFSDPIAGVLLAIEEAKRNYLRGEFITSFNQVLRHETYGGVEYLHTFLTSPLDGGGQLYYPAALPLENSLRYPLDRSVGGLRADLDEVAKRKISLPGIKSLSSNL